MISVEEALARILAAFEPLPVETVSLERGLGRVLAADVVARVSQPPAAVSAMDGYAARAQDLQAVPTELRVIGAAPAGDSFEGEVGPGEAVRIFTGGPVPKGADCIVIQEDTEAEGERVTVKASAESGRYVRPAGLDFAVGAIGAAAGHLMTARDIGLAAAMNVPWLQVRRRPRVAVLATGDEVVMPGDPLGPNQIVSSNALALSAMIRACGGDPINLGIAKDRVESLRELVKGAQGADLLLTTGGVSVGEHDLIHHALSQEGLELDFWKIAMRPGKPLLFGRLGTTPVLGLPGNPVSSVVCALLFMRPVIERLLGQAPREDKTETAILASDLPANDHRQDYLRANLQHDSPGQAKVVPFSRQDSSMLSSLAHSDCLVLRPPHAPAISAGNPVPILRLTGGVLGI